MIISVYRMPSYYRFQLFATLGVFAIAATVLLTLTATTGTSAPTWFVVVWSVGVVYVGYNFLWKVAYELRLEGDLFVWRTPLRSGSEPAQSILGIRPPVSAPNAERIDLSSGPRITVIMRRGLADFLRDFSEVAPGVPVEVGSYFVRMVERWPVGGTGYQRWWSPNPPPDPSG